MTVLTLGPYRFSTTDRDRTLAHGLHLFDLLTDGLGPDAHIAAEVHRRRAAAAMSTRGGTDPDGALAVLWSEWRSAMTAVRATGAFGPPAVGAVAGLFLSDGGVPKVPVERVDVDYGGVVGDRQAARVHHGRPWQALCLWSTEVVDVLAGDGHGIRPGAAGENVSITGLRSERVRPGSRLRIGDVTAEVSTYAVPCVKNDQWFADGNSQRIHHRNGPISRAYATVVTPGGVTIGDVVTLEPAERAAPATSSTTAPPSIDDRTDR